ncbi:hypothetical protein GOP47_0018982 [Adiantum capillus-veneris]|uniref:Morc S5 domain-containing protein n=1 Tax=Adiantum capillus-veneris TaxID=13818 RepID=A0A9D4UE79_ADICA|nr:hypothetical protein GOP47_0018982 [Adiantum capillus-veneris]
MMHKEVKCEDVIDLSSDDEDFPQAEPLNEGTSDIAGHLGSPRQGVLNAQQCALFGIPDESRPVVKDEACVLDDAHDRSFPQFHFQNPFTGTALPTNAQQKQISRNFWKAGDYDAIVSHNRAPASGIDHVRVHPKFLHSNATSHKWALGAIAELLDNAIDEVQNGATSVRVDVIHSPLDGTPMLLVQDDGCGMDPDCLRQCMSLGYSRKITKTTIGQYGNGFKTSTMRLGADVIVFSRCIQNGYETESIGLLSYTFLRKTDKEDIIVPMIDFQLPLNSGTRNILLRTTNEDWLENLKMILEWSPFRTEGELLSQFADVCSHGTKIIVYNLWLNDDDELELDFDTDRKDIQLRGGARSSKSGSIQRKFTNEHISNRLRYSLRAYASVLYLRMPDTFQIILRGEPVQHFSIAADLKFPEHILYKPQVANVVGDVSVITTIGFAKEAPMINVHGFSVYHKNRLIMPFWKVFHENSSRGKGVVGVLEANFMEPAHDKQDFERTPVLQRLEGRLKSMTIEYWNLHCDLVGYQPPKRVNKTTANATNTSNIIPGFSSVQNLANQPILHSHQAAIATGIPAHLVGVATPFSFDPSNFQRPNPLESQVSLGTIDNVVDGLTAFPPTYKEGRTELNSRSTSRCPGTSGPPTPPQPKSDTEMVSKHADTVSDGCSYLASSFQSDCSESSLNAYAGAKLGRANQQIAAREEIARKRLATEASLEAMDPAAKRLVTRAMEGGILGLGDGGPPLHGNSDAVDSIEDIEQLRLRCKHYLWEKQQLEVKVLRLQQDLIQLHDKLKVHESQSRMVPKSERLE